jgi:hypothetical protein
MESKAMLYKIAVLLNEVKATCLDITPWIVLGGALLSIMQSFPNGGIVGTIFIALYVALYVNIRTH